METRRRRKHGNKLNVVVLVNNGGGGRAESIPSSTTKISREETISKVLRDGWELFSFVTGPARDPIFALHTLGVTN